jgi:hypothetical protein
MILVFLLLLESSGYKFNEGYKTFATTNTFFFPGRYSNVTPYSSRGKNQYSSRSEAFKPLKVLFLWSVKTIIGLMVA